MSTAATILAEMGLTPAAAAPDLPAKPKAPEAPTTPRTDTTVLAAAAELRRLAAEEGVRLLRPGVLLDEAAALLDVPDAQRLAYLRALSWSQDMEAGLPPAGWTMTAQCASCGPVFILPSPRSRIDACPWCRNRKAGRPIPRPPVRCEACVHFRPDPLNTRAGVGACGLNLTLRNREPLRFPSVPRRCDRHSPIDAPMVSHARGEAGCEHESAPGAAGPPRPAPHAGQKGAFAVHTAEGEVTELRGLPG